MAKYDRDFLVPYLRDICSLYMAKEKLNWMILESNREVKLIETRALNGIKQYEPYVYRQDDATEIGGCLSGGLCTMGLLSIFLTILSGDPVGVGVGGLLICTVAGIAVGKITSNAEDRKRKEIEIRNDEMERKYVLQQRASLAKVEPQITQVKKRIDYLKAECKKIDKLLTQNYSLNIIPGWYRDKYSAVYLYDWFSKSQADDLDMALNTFVLEQIKDKLDVIIRNQSEELLNQRIMIANQNKSIRQAESHHAELMNKLNQMQAADEERNAYLSMIETNTAVDAYFSIATYLKS